MTTSDWPPGLPRQITARELERAMSPGRIVESQRNAFLDLAHGSVTVPGRLKVSLPAGELLLMPAVHHRAGLAGVKILTGLPANPAHGLPANQATFTLIDANSGAVLAVMDGTWMTAARTGGVAALALDAMGPPIVDHLAVLGTGPVAYWATRCALAVRRPARIAVWSRTPDSAHAFARRIQEVIPESVRVTVAYVPEEAVSGAQAVVTATQSSSPLLRAGDIQPGAHISAMGGTEPGWEIAVELLEAARLVVDSVAAWSEASDVAASRLAHGGRLVTLDSVLAAENPAPRDEGRPSILPSVGWGFQDLGLAMAAYRRLGAGAE